MTQTDWVDLLQMIPQEQHNQLIVMSRTGIELAIDLVIRTEPAYFVFRGRVCGNTDEGRVFFFPYNEINCVYLNRIVKENEISELFADQASVDENALINGIYENDEKQDQVTTPPVANSPNPTPMSIPTIAAQGGNAIPRPAPIVIPGIKLPPVGAPQAAGANPRGSSPIIPGLTAPMTSAASPDAATPKGSILERLRNQRNLQNKSR